MYQGTYASVAECITVMYDNNVRGGDKIQATVLRDCTICVTIRLTDVIVLLAMRQLVLLTMLHFRE